MDVLLENSEERISDVEKKSQEMLPNMVTMISLIISIIPVLIINVSFVGKDINSKVVCTINGCLLLAISLVYAMVAYVVLGKKVDIRISILIVAIIFSIILIA